MTIQKVHPLPPPLPSGREGWVLYVKHKPSLNDLVQEIHDLLLEDEALKDRYNELLYAVWPEQAVEGNLTHDDAFAAQMIRDRARLEDSPVQKEKTSTIAKSLRVVLKRYHQSRDERREALGGEITPDDNVE